MPEIDAYCRAGDRINTVYVVPAMYSSTTAHSATQAKAWRSNLTRELVTRILGDADAMKAGIAT